MCVVCVLCLIVVPLPPGKIPFAVKINNNNRWTDLDQIFYSHYAIGGYHSLALFNTYLLTYGAEPFLRGRQLCSHSGASQHFKEPEGSSPCSQESSTCP
jgi:hypothetical protein